MQNFQNMFFNENNNLNQLNEATQKSYESLVKASQIHMENSQAIMKRVGEIVQKQVTESVEATKDILSSSNPEQAMNKHQNFLQKSTKNAFNDSKEVAEMVAKASMEMLDAAAKNSTEVMQATTKKPVKA